MMPAMSTALPLRTTPSPPERLSRNLGLTGVVALILLCVTWELWLAPTGRGSLALKAVPLLLALPGLWRYRMYTFRWLSLLVWLYCGEGLVRVTSARPLEPLLAVAEIALSVTVFAACSLQVRQRLKAAKA